MQLISAISLSRRTLFVRLMLAVSASHLGISAPALRALTPQNFA